MKQPPAAAGSTRKKDSSSSSEESDSEEEQTAKAPAQSKSILSNLFKLRLGKILGYLIYCMHFWITEPKAGAVTTPKAAVAAKGAAQKKKESSSSEDSSSDSEDEKPAKVHKAFFMLLCVVDCLTLSQVWCVADKCMQQILTAYFHVFCQAPVKPAPVKPTPVNKAAAESSSEDSSSEDEAPPSKKPKAGVFSCFLTTIQAAH